VLLIGLWLILGATYELIKCYINSNNNASSIDNESQVDYNHKNFAYVVSSSNVIKGTKLKNPENTKKNSCLIYTGLVILGIFAQPFYLLFKCIEIMMECYRKFGCWLYFFVSY